MAYARALGSLLVAVCALTGTASAQTYPNPVSYTHLTLPTIYSV